MSTTECEYINYPCALVSSNKGANWRVDAVGIEDVSHALELRKSEPDGAQLDILAVLEWAKERPGENDSSPFVPKSRFEEAAQGIPYAWLGIV